MFPLDWQCRDGEKTIVLALTITCAFLPFQGSCQAQMHKEFVTLILQLAQTCVEKQSFSSSWASQHGHHVCHLPGLPTSLGIPCKSKEDGSRKNNSFLRCPSGDKPECQEEFATMDASVPPSSLPSWVYRNVVSFEEWMFAKEPWAMT